MLVVRVTCKVCGHPLGVAIVGTVAEVTKKSPACPPDWTRRDLERLAAKPAISFDDVLAAHNFIKDLDANWAQHLPKLGKLT